VGKFLLEKKVRLLEKKMLLGNINIIKKVVVNSQDQTCWPKTMKTIKKLIND